MTVALARSEATLESRYASSEGWFYMTGMQALVRLPIQQRLRDAAAGLNTGGYISGYRGSPLGRYDIELWRAGPLLESRNIVFRPGLNEDLAATAIWGAQHLTSFPGATVDGVFGIWYGKGPGVDRSGDALRHANFTGVSPKGGVIALAGDDHGAKSSTAVNFSDTSFIAVGMPVLYPSNTQELIDFGLHGIAMSRFSGCWVGVKVVTDVAEGGGTVYVGLDSPAIAIPERPSNPPGGVGARAIDMPVAQEERLYNHKLPAALAYARANALNRIVGGANARVGVVGAGKAWQDLLQALGHLRHAGGGARWICACSRSAWSGRSIRSSCATSPSDSISSSSSRRSARFSRIRFARSSMARTARRASSASFSTASSSIPPTARSPSPISAKPRRSWSRRCCSTRSARAIRIARSPLPGLDQGDRQPSRSRAQSRVLRRLSAQPLDPRARGQPRACRHRLPHDGDVCEPVSDDHGLAYGRRRGDVARPAAFHEPATRIRQSRRRHLCPFRRSGGPSGRRRRRADHL